MSHEVSYNTHPMHWHQLTLTDGFDDNYAISIYLRHFYEFTVSVASFLGADPHMFDMSYVTTQIVMADRTYTLIDDSPEFLHKDFLFPTVDDQEQEDDDEAALDRVATAVDTHLATLFQRSADDWLAIAIEVQL